MFDFKINDSGRLHVKLPWRRQANRFEKVLGRKPSGIIICRLPMGCFYASDDLDNGIRKVLHKLYLGAKLFDHVNKTIPATYSEYIEREQMRQNARKISKTLMYGGIEKVCEACGISTGAYIWGPSVFMSINVRIVRHHTDYNNPLNVTFLCNICHSILHQMSEVSTTGCGIDSETLMGYYTKYKLERKNKPRSDDRCYCKNADICNNCYEASFDFDIGSVPDDEGDTDAWYAMGYWDKEQSLDQQLDQPDQLDDE